MTPTDGSISCDQFVARLLAAETRLARLAREQPPSALTEPDPDTGERWGWGHLWAHVAEFLPYWLEQARLVVERGRERPTPFGRVKSDPGRLAGIEQRLSERPAVLMEQISRAVSEWQDFLEQLGPAGWQAAGRHSRLGEMSVSRIVEEFVVGHVEDHICRLEGLLAQERPLPGREFTSGAAGATRPQDESREAAGGAPGV